MHHSRFLSCSERLVRMNMKYSHCPFLFHRKFVMDTNIETENSWRISVGRFTATQVVLGECYFTRVYVETRGRSVGPLSRRRELTGRLTCELLRANYCNRNGRKHSTHRLMDQYVSRMSSFVYGPPLLRSYISKFLDGKISPTVAASNGIHYRLLIHLPEFKNSNSIQTYLS